MKRAFLILILVALAVFSVHFIPSVNAEEVEGSAEIDDSATNDSWPMFQHDPAHTGYSTSKAPKINNTLWTYTTLESVDSSPTVVDGRVFIGSHDYNIYSLNETTGTLIWRYKTEGWPTSPTVSGGRVFIGSGDNIYSLNASTGALVWNYTTGLRIYSSPTVVDGRVFVGSMDHKVYALNESTGALVWSYTTGDYVLSSPAVVDDKVFIGSNDGNIYSLNATTGTKIWNYTLSQTHTSQYSSPAYSMGRIFIGTRFPDNKLYCLNYTTGELIWSYAVEGSIHATPAIAHGKVYVGVARDRPPYYSGHVYSLNASNGALIWKHTSTNVGSYIDSSPAVADGKIFLGMGKDIRALNETDGELIWSYTTGLWIYSSPAIANGKIFIGSYDGKVYCFGPPPILTINTSGVSSHSPVTVTVRSNAEINENVNTIYDGSPLEITFYNWRWEGPIIGIIDINSTRVWRTDPSSRYVFTGWTGPATGTSSSNPITITLYANSSCTANYKTQYLTNITFKDNGGVTTLYTTPTQIQALTPNGSPVILTSYSNQWLDNGTWTLKQVLWQDNNVKPSIDPTYNPTPGGTWNINCRVYSINFTESFRDGGGEILYANPWSFRLTFPNGTTSAPLKVGTYFIQNGTTTWSSIIWQDTNVAPASAAFDATDGNPTVNCEVYSLTVDPIFNDNTGVALWWYVQPSSWTIEFPNGTTRTLSSPVTYNQTQAGNYSIVSIIWKETEVVPDITPTTSLTFDMLWSPSIDCLLPTSISVSLSSSTSYVGFKVEINGSLTCNEAGLSGAPILLSYSVTDGASWNDITLVKTGADGGYSAVWMPSATGNYLVRAIWSGNETYPGSNAVRALAVTSFKDQYVFSISSNSTVSSLAFNSTSRVLSFTVSGPSDTTGYVEVTIAKALVVDITELKVYLNGTEISYTTASTDDSWLLYFTYPHSTYSIMISLGPSVGVGAPNYTPYIIAGAIGVTLVVAVHVMRRRRSNRRMRI